MPSFKKLISALCAAAMVSTALVVPVMAADAGDLIDSHDFTGVNFGRFLQDTSSVTKDLEHYVEIANGARKDGANGNTGWYGQNNGYVEADIGQYVSSGRGPKMNFTVPAEDIADERITLKFDYYPINGTGNTADLYIVDSATGKDIDGENYNGAETPSLAVGTDLNENAWNSVEVIIETDGTSILKVNDSIKTVGTMTASAFPQLQFTQTNSDKDKQSRGRIDNVKLYKGGETGGADWIAIAKASIALDDTQEDLIKNSDGSYSVSGNFTLPETIPAVTLTWSVLQREKNSSDDWTDCTFAQVEGNTVVITMTSDMDNYDTKLVGYLECDGESDTVEYELILITLSDIVKAIQDEETILYYSADAKGKILTVEPDDGIVIFNDVVFPTSADVEVLGKIYTVDVKWTVDSGSDYLLAKGAISVPDTDAYPIKLTRTVSYSDAEPLVTTYNMYVQFDPDAVRDAVEAAVETAGDAAAEAVTANAAEDADESTVSAAAQAAKKEVTDKLDDYITAFVSNYQVKFDAALDDNFSDIPSSAKGGEKFDLPSEGVFGSTFTWSSSSSDTIKVSNSTNKATVSTPSSTKNVTLTATVKAGDADSKKHTESVKVTGSSSSGSSSSSGGSSRSGGSGSATSIAGNTSYNSTVTTPSGTTTINPNPSGFTDLGSVSWALTAINNLYVNGVISGKTSTEFYPNDAITRAEFAKILVNAFHITTVNANTATFYDVPLSHWASSYVETAAANGIIKGYDDGSFEPNTKISRQEMAVMVLRAAQAAGYTFTDKREAASFNDASSIASYAKDAVDTLYKAGVVNGVDGNAFEPLSTSTRAQACQIIYNVFN